MKRIVCILLAALLLAAVAFSGCAPAYDKTPAEYEDVRWVTPDYSFRFNPEDDCKGDYTYNGTKYKIQVAFDGSHVSVKDTDKDKELFYGEWMYEDGDKLYIYNIAYNKADYEDFKNNFGEFYRLHQEKL